MTGSHRTRSGGWWVVPLLCLVALGVAIYGSVRVLQGPSYSSTSTLTQPISTPSPEPSATPSPERTVLTATTPVAPDTRPKRIATTEPEVLQRTKFVMRYRQGQPAISRKHPDMGDNSLASHGLGICAMIADPNVSIFDMVDRFMRTWHAHPGPVTTEAALLVNRIAVDEICPDLAGALARKERL